MENGIGSESSTGTGFDVFVSGIESLCCAFGDLLRFYTELYNSLDMRQTTNLLVFKGKSVPLQAWTGPEGSRKLMFPDFVTKTQDSGKVASLKHRPPLPPGNTPGSHFC